MSRTPIWTRERLIVALRQWAERHGGEPPRRRDWNTAGPDHPTGESVYRVFGSWSEALRAAGLPHEQARPVQSAREGGWPPAAILDAIVQWAETYGEPPKLSDWNPWIARQCGDIEAAERFERERGAWPNSSTVVARFGSWNAGLQAASQRTTQCGLKRTTPRPRRAAERAHTSAWTKTEIIAALRADPSPSYRGWQPADPTGARPTTRTVLRHFGSWSAAKRAAGLPASPRDV